MKWYYKLQLVITILKAMHEASKEESKQRSRATIVLPSVVLVRGQWVALHYEYGKVDARGRWQKQGDINE